MAVSYFIWNSRFLLFFSTLAKTARLPLCSRRLPASACATLSAPPEFPRPGSHSTALSSLTVFLPSCAPCRGRHHAHVHQDTGEATDTTTHSSGSLSVSSRWSSAKAPRSSARSSAARANGSGDDDDAAGGGEARRGGGGHRRKPTASATAREKQQAERQQQQAAGRGAGRNKSRSGGSDALRRSSDSSNASGGGGGSRRGSGTNTDDSSHYSTAEDEEGDAQVTLVDDAL